MFIRERMTRTPSTITGDITVIDALNLMKAKNVRHLPVLSRDGQIAGMVSEKDLFYCLPFSGYFAQRVGGQRNVTPTDGQ